MRLKDYSHDTHPELLKGEMFYCNVYNGERPTGDSMDLKVGENGRIRLTSEFEDIGFKSKRMGQIAYDNNGNYVGHATRPVFISIAEYDKHENSLFSRFIKFVITLLERFDKGDN